MKKYIIPILIASIVMIYVISTQYSPKTEATKETEITDIDKQDTTNVDEPELLSPIASFKNYTLNNDFSQIISTHIANGYFIVYGKAAEDEIARLYISNSKDDDFAFNTLDIHNTNDITTLWTNPNNDLLIIQYGLEESSLVTYSLSEKRILHDTAFDNSLISHIYPLNDKQILYVRHNPEGDYLALNNYDLTSHMDLMKLPMGGNEIQRSYVDDVTISNNLKYLTYSVKVEGDIQLYMQDLTTNETTLLDTSTKGLKPIWLGDNTLAYQNPFHIIYYNTTNKEKQKIAIEDSLNSSSLYATGMLVSFVHKELLTLAKVTLDVPRDILVDHSPMLTEREGRETQTYDLVIRNGIVIDPETQTFKFNHHIGIKDNEIKVITTQDIKGTETIDATGQIVSPGFIDLLSYNPNTVGIRYKIADGVTTNLSMHGCSIDFPSFFSYYERNPIKMNYGGALFSMQLREKLGIGRYQKATDAQIEQLQVMARDAIKDGAIGIAFSPEYYPGTSDKEIKAIMEIGKEFGLTTFFHGRYSSISGEKTNIDTVKEIIGYAEELNAPVHVMHINSTGGTRCMEEALSLIESARNEGLDITYCTYPYDYWATYIGSARFDRGWQDRFGISYEDLQLAGTTMRLDEKSFNELRKTWQLVIAYAILEEDVIRSLQTDFGMLGSDTIIRSEEANDHPRGSGTYSRTIGYYAREKDVISLMQALQYMTINVCKRLENVAPSLKKRGRLQEGSIADITIFDYNTIIDTAAPEKPASYSKGVHYVIVNGEIVKTPDGLTDANPGQPIKGEF